MIGITSKYTKISETYVRLRTHIDSIWPLHSKNEYTFKEWPMGAWLPNWRVVEIEPTTAQGFWVYLSLGTWEVTKDERYEAGRYGIDFLIISPQKDESHIKTLAMVAIYHSDPKYRLNLGHVMRIGDPWMIGATCDHFLVSYPYLFPPELETILINDIYISFWWLFPITAKEAQYAEEQGVEALERKLERKKVDALDIRRKSVVRNFPF